ncbi:MAG TPA: hypothetical protein VGJ93_01440 [Desulfuromonadaceae bacterium]|jgi:hypothetical protein
MKNTQYEKVCYASRQQEENVPLKNLTTGQIGYSYGCTFEGNTIQVRMKNGELDSWDKNDCVVVSDEEEADVKPR